MFSVYMKLGWFFKENWKRYTSAILLLAIVNVLEVFPVRFVGMTIDHLHQGTITEETLMKYAAVLGVILVCVYIMGITWQKGLYGGAAILERKMRYRFIGHLLKMAPRFFEKHRTGDLMARATNDLKAISNTAGFGILSFTDAILFTGVILCMMGFSISWELTLLSILPLPIMAWLMKVYGKKLHMHFTEAQDSFGKMNDSVLESVAGVRVIRAYAQENQSEDRFAEMAEDVYQKNRKVAMVDSFFDPTIKILVGISYLIGIGYGSKMVFEQVITLGDLISFNVYLGMLIWPMFAIGELINIMQRGNASLDRFQEVLDADDSAADAEDSAYSLSGPVNIVFSGVNFRYPASEVMNLIDVDFEVGHGETLGIVGKTGSGKTTIMRQLLREYPPGEGEITISGISLQNLKLEDTRSWIGYVPQDPFLFSKTIEENILFGNQKASDEELMDVVESADFKKDLESLAEGLQTLVGEKGVGLSGGQKQRISIARALLKNPEILLLDDSLSAVDAKTEKQIIGNVRRERKGKTTIIASHRLSAIAHADLIIVLDHGRIIEKGTHEDLLRNDGWYKEQYIRQQLGEGMEVEE